MTYALIKLAHLVAAILWVGGMAFIMVALRPPLAAQLQPPVRLPLGVAILKRFFTLVWVCIGTLLASGLWLLMQTGMKAAPQGWHVMLGVGFVMMLLFAHLYFAPFKRLKRAVAAQDWPEAGQRMNQVTLLAKINLGLGWLAIAAVFLLK
jgi:uncharacterized membrane protein